MYDMRNLTRHNVSVHKSTKNRLKDLGKKDETYNDIITRLLDHWDNTHKENKDKGELK